MAIAPEIRHPHRDLDSYLIDIKAPGIVSCMRVSKSYGPIIGSIAYRLGGCRTRRSPIRSTKSTRPRRSRCRPEGTPVYAGALFGCSVTVAAPEEPRSVASFRCPVALQPSTRQLARDACGKFELRLFEPKSPLPGNGILRAETKRPKRL